RRRGAFEHAINLCGLCKVGDLGSATIVSKRWKQVVLDDGAQSDVWTKAFRCLLGHRCELFRRVLFLAVFRSVFSVLESPHGVPRALLVMQEQWERIRRREHLRVISVA